MDKSTDLVYIDLRSDTLRRFCCARAALLPRPEGPFMQHLLDFVHEHTLEEQLFVVVEVASGELELLWQRRNHPSSWQLRPHKSDAPYQLVERESLLDNLQQRGANMERVETELRAIVMTQIAYANLLLSDASVSLGQELLQAAMIGHDAFSSALTGAVTELVIRPQQSIGRQRDKPRLSLLVGGGVQSESRSGHLRIVS